MKVIQKFTKLFLAFCCFVSLIQVNQLVETKAADNGEIIDDTHSRFEYSAGNANNGGWGAYDDGSGDPAVSEHWSNSAGATLNIPFNGTKIELYGKAAPNHAMFSVSIDGGEAVECDAYAANAEPNKKLFESDELTNGEHTALITVLGKRNPDSTGSGNVYGVQFVYAKVFGGDNLSVPFPGYTVIEDVKTTESDELFKIKYNGEWGGGTSYYPDLFHDGYEHYAHNGDSFEMKFIGTKVEIFGTKASNHGVYTITIDGEAAGEANATASSKVHQQLLYTSPELENKEHTLKAELLNQPGQAIQIDYLQVYHDENLPVSKLTLSEEEVRLGIGQTTSVNVTAEPWIVNNPEIEWSSENTSIATVDENGLIKAAAKSASETHIIATVKNSDVSASLKVIVDPTIQALSASVGNEKLLDTQENYNTLLTAEQVSSWSKTAWRGDELNSKINVLTRDKAVHSVNITASDFTDGKGNVIPASNIEIKWLKNIRANIGRGNSSAPVKDFPDIIYKDEKIDIDAGTARFAWVNISVPKDTHPGTYTSTITVTADELSSPIALTYELEVLNLEQPELENTEIQIWQHPFAVANYYLGLGAKPSGGISNELNNDFYFTDQHFNLMRASIKEYVSLGGHDAVANIVEEAWNHQSYYNDPSMVKWTKKADGTWEFDYTWYDAWINFMIDCGVLDPANGIGKIKCYSIVPWNNQVAYYDEASQTTKKESFSPGSDAWKAIWTPFLTDFMEHSKAKGWFDITYISMDERPLAQLQPAVEMIESVKDENGEYFKISSALNYAAPQYYDFTDRVHDISINQESAGNLEQMNALTAHRKEKGLTTTFYSCTGDYPSNYIISDPGDNYWDIWYTLTIGSDGFMRWAWDNYVYDMHGNVSYRYWEPGDGWFIYPQEKDEIDASYNASFYSTPRYEMLKQGMRDVAKAKYLMEQSDEMNQEITDLTKSMKTPKAGGSYGSKVPADQTQRMLVHSETDRMYAKVTELAREYAKQINPVVKEALKTEIDKANALVKDDYTSESWNKFTKVFESAKAVYADENATQDAVDQAVNDLKAAMAALEKETTEPNEPTQPDKPGEPDKPSKPDIPNPIEPNKPIQPNKPGQIENDINPIVNTASAPNSEATNGVLLCLGILAIYLVKKTKTRLEKQ